MLFRSTARLELSLLGKNSEPLLQFFDSKQMTLSTGDKVPTTRVSLDNRGINLFDKSGEIRTILKLDIADDEPQFEISDSHGFSTIIGNVGLVIPATGEKQQTSAASIRMFNEKGNVIWAVPPQ